MQRLALVSSLLFAVVVTAAGAAGPVTEVVDGRLVFASARGCASGLDLFTMRPNGTGVRRLTSTCFAGKPAWSSDGRAIAYVSAQDGGSSIYTMRFDGSNPQRVTAQDVNASDPAWSPDSSRIAFTSRPPDGSVAVDVIDADGGNLRVLRTDGYASHPSWSLDGTRIAFQAFAPPPDGRSHIWTMKADGTDVTDLATGWTPAWSPDGGRIAFVTYDGNEIDTVRPDRSDLRTVVSDLPVESADSDLPAPAWSPDSSRLVYDTQVSSTDPASDREIFGVSVDGGAATRLTVMAGFDGQTSWQPLAGAVEVGPDLVAIAPGQAQTLVLGPPHSDTARACRLRPLRLRVAVTDGDGHRVRGATVLARGARVRPARIATGTTGIARLTLHPNARLRRGTVRITLSTSRAPASTRSMVVPVRCG
jgi:Tol biopolymer transport system component